VKAGRWFERFFGTGDPSHRHSDSAGEFAIAIERPVFLRASRKRVNRGKIFARNLRRPDFRLASEGNRERREKCEGKMRHGLAKFRPIRSIPGINRVERCEQGRVRALDHPDQIEACVRDGARAIGKTDQRERPARRPHFGISGARRFEFRQRENHVADRAWTDEKTPQDYFKP